MNAVTLQSKITESGIHSTPEADRFVIALPLRTDSQEGQYREQYRSNTRCLNHGDAKHG